MIFVYSELTVVFYYCLFLRKKNCNLYPLSTLLYLIGTDFVCVCVLEYRLSKSDFKTAVVCP